MKTGALVSALAALCLVAQAGWAETSAIARAGGWEAFGGTTTTGRPVCGISSNDKDGRYVGLKFFSGDTTATVQLGWGGWKIENGAKQALRLTFDAETPWNATGTGMHFNDGDAGLEFTIKSDELGQFIKEFRGSKQLIIVFVGSSAQPWNNFLDGVDTIGDHFMTCMRSLK